MGCGEFEKVSWKITLYYKMGSEEYTKWGWRNEVYLPEKEQQASLI